MIGPFSFTDFPIEDLASVLGTHALTYVKFTFALSSYLLPAPLARFDRRSQVTGWEGALGETLDLQEQVGMDSLQAVEFRRIICTQVRESVRKFLEPLPVLFSFPSEVIATDNSSRVW